jgi:hypothetical protein
MRATLTLLLAAAVVSGVPSAARPQTLRDLIAALGTDTRGLTVGVLDQEVSDSATLAEAGEYGVAYRPQSRPGTSAPLCLAFRPRGGQWLQRSLASTGPAGFGSLLRMSALSSRILIETHLGPSAGTVVVVRRDLTPAAELFGFFPKELPGGLIVFSRSMVHFAPAHPEALGVYDPRADRIERLYPSDGTDDLGGTAGPANGSPLRQKFVAALGPTFAEAARRERNAYGWNPDWFDVTIEMDSLSLATATDTLSFAATFSIERPLPAGLEPPPVTQVHVECRPMSQPTRRCVESAR